MLDKQFTTYALLDNGSEIFMMPRRVHERLDLSIDRHVDWCINEYNTEINTMLKEVRSIDCCHDVSIDVGDVKMKLSIFIIEYYNSDIILGRPWECMMRIQYINEDDGSMTMIIKSLDGDRFAKFYIIKGEHERNREYIRHAEKGVIEEDFLKV